MVTKEQLDAGGIILESYDDKSLLYADAALDWLEDNTSLTIDRDNLAALPSGAKLFINQFPDLASRTDNVTSESIDGLSRSYSSSTKNDLILDLARGLLGKYLTGQVSFKPAGKRWLVYGS